MTRSPVSRAPSGSAQPEPEKRDDKALTGRKPEAGYGSRPAAYDLKKLRGKQIGGADRPDASLPGHSRRTESHRALNGSAGESHPPPG
jgi:hypothetical protein